MREIKFQYRNESGELAELRILTAEDQRGIELWIPTEQAGEIFELLRGGSKWLA